MNKPLDGSEEIGFTYSLKILWKRKIFILAATLLVTVISLIYWLSVPRVYESESYIRAYYPHELNTSVKSKNDFNGSRLEFRLYKMWSGDIIKRLNKKNFLLFLKANKVQDDPDKNLATREKQRLFIEVIPSFVYKNIRNRQEERKNFVTEFRLIVSAGDAQAAVTINRLLREFVAAYIINDRIIEHFKKELGENNLRIKNNTGFLRNLERALEKRKQRRILLLKTNRRFAPLDNLDKSVGVVERLEKFRTPMQRLMELEINIANTEHKITETKQTLEILRLKKELYAACREMMEEDDAIFRSNLLAHAIMMLADFRKQHSQSKIDSRDVIQNIDSFLYEYQIYRDNTFKFSLEPTSPAVLRYPKTWWNVLLAFVLSLLMFSMAAFIMESWHRVRIA